MAHDPLLHVTTTVDRDTARVAIGGELDMSNCAQLEDRMRELVTTGCRDLVADLSSLRFVDSTGLSVFVTIHKELQAAGGSMRVEGAQPPVLKVMELTGLTAILSGETADG